MNILIKASKIQIRIKSKIKIGKLKLNKGIKEKDLSVPQFGGYSPFKIRSCIFRCDWQQE